MAATSTQRFWADGRQRLEKIDPDYENSFWMKGISFTRDIRYAMSWGRLVISIDQAKLAQRIKMLPYNWGYHMSGWAPQDTNKREREEFAIVKRTPDDYKFPSDHDERPGEFDFQRFRSEDGQIEGYIPLEPILTGIWLEWEMGSLYEPGPQRWDHEKHSHVRDGIVEAPYYIDRDMIKAGYSIADFIAHPKFKGYFNSGQNRGDTMGFKLWPKTTPREELPPRAF